MRKEGITTTKGKKERIDVGIKKYGKARRAVVFSRERIVPDLRRCELVKPSDVKRISVCFNRSPAIGKFNIIATTRRSLELSN